MDTAFLVPTEDSAEADGTLIFPIGKFYRDGKERSFTSEDADVMVRNFKERVLGQDRLPPVNREHKREAGKIGSIVDLWVSEDGVRGTVEGDLTGFDYISPEVRWAWVNPYTGAQHKNVLMGAGATNYPFFLDRMSLNDDAALLWTGSDWRETTDDDYADREELRKARAARAKKYGISAKENGALTPPKGYPENASAYGDPVNYAYPADGERAKAALTYFNQAKNREAGGYSTEEWGVIGKRLATLISKQLRNSYQYDNGRLVRREQPMAANEAEQNEDYQDESSMEEDMTEELKEQLEQFASDLEATKAELETLKAQNQALEAQLAELEAEPEPAEEPVEEEPVEEASNEPTEDYAEKLAALEEEFTAKLDAERQERERFSDLYQQERNTRRMAEFTDKVTGFSFGIDGVEQFAEDLMAMEDQDAELYGRMLARFSAINEQMASGDLFAQHTVAGGEAEETDPFEREVEKVRKEQFSDEDYAVGFTKALDVVTEKNPELARRYAEQS